MSRSQLLYPRAPLISVASGICVLRRELAAYFCVTVSVPTAQELADMHPYSVPIPVHASTDSLEITDVV